MQPISFKRYSIPGGCDPARGVDVSYETVQCWTIKFGPQIATRLKRRRPAPSPRWHLDEMVCAIGGRRMYLWRAVDDEGEVLDLVVQPRRDTEAALKLFRRLLHNQSVGSRTITTAVWPCMARLWTGWM